MSKPTKITLHHTDSDRDKTTVSQINEWHKVRWPDFKSLLGYYVGYHYVITGDGKVTQTRADNEPGAHTRGYNEGNIGICLTGRFMEQSPSQGQLESLTKLTERLKMTYGITEIKAHRDYCVTECCGNNLYTWVLQQKVNWLQNIINKLLNK